jgi:membrane-bound hydrogenase subunit beta
MDINADSMNVKEISAEEIKESFEKKFPAEQIIDIKLDHYNGGVRNKKLMAPHLWVRMKRDSFHEAVRHLSKYGAIHNSVASGSDLGDEIEVLYHLSLFSEKFKGQITVTMGVRVPKEDPRYESISDIIPSAVVTEREKQEFLGVIVENIPDPRRLFLAETGIPENVFPWRWDETGVVAQGFVTEVHKKYPAPGSEEEKALKKAASENEEGDL